MSESILVVDDEPDIRELVRLNLVKEGFDVETAGTGSEALERVALSQPDLIVLDLLLPDQSGTEICRKLRGTPETAHIPIIMLTARSEEFDRVVGFELAADDYVTKPFSPRELALRVKAVLRRSAQPGPVQNKLEQGGLEIDLERHRCRIDGSDVDLTAKEFGLLSTLMGRPGHVLSRERLLETVWGSDVTVTLRTIDTHMKRLREKLGSAGEMIQTVRGVGYRFDD